MTSWDAFTGENFRRGGFLPQDQRYDRAREFLAATRELFDSWRGDEVVADKDSGAFLRRRPTRAGSPCTPSSSTSRASSTCPAARRAAR